MTVLPNDIKENKSSGLFIYEDWKTGRSNYERYIENKLFSPITYNLTPKMKAYNKKARADPDIPCLMISYTVCAGDEDYTSCTTRYQSMRNCVGSGGGNTGQYGGGGNTPPITGDGGTFPDKPDCEGLLIGTAFVSECGQCIGGTTGISSCKQWFDDKIDDEELPDCMKSILDVLKKLPNGNSITDIIQKFTGDVPGYTWKLGTYEGTNNLTYGFTNKTSPNSGQVNTYLNFNVT